MTMMERNLASRTLHFERHGHYTFVHLLKTEIKFSEKLFFLLFLKQKDCRVYKDTFMSIL